MGILLTHACPACGYNAHVSGGQDTGAENISQTMLCFDCRILFDRHAPYGEAIKLRCKKSPKHRVRAWNHPDTCPRCEATMEIVDDGEMMLWD